MASVKISISLTPEAAAALRKAARTQGLDRSRVVDNAIRAVLIRPASNAKLGVPGVPLRPGRLEKLRDIAKMGRIRRERDIESGRISLGV